MQSAITVKTKMETVKMAAVTSQDRGGKYRETVSVFDWLWFFWPTEEKQHQYCVHRLSLIHI